MIASHKQIMYFRFAMKDVQEEIPEFLDIVTKAFFTNKLDVGLASEIIGAHKGDDYETIKKIVEELDV